MPAPKKPAVPVATVAPLMLLRPNALASNEYDLLIYGQIGESWWDEESVTAKSVVDQLNALPESVTQINVRINSIGGSVHDGLAIYNALNRHAATIAVTVDGVAMSAASFIAMAGDTVHTPSTSIWMIHGPSTFAGGNALELRAVAAALDVYASSMAPAYAAKSGKSVDDILALLNDGADHFYTGDQAVAEGFADAVVAEVEPETVPAEARAALLAAVERRTASAPQTMHQLAIAAVGRAPAADGDPAAPIRPAKPATTTGVIDMPNTTPTAPAADPAADVAAITAAAHESLRTRNADIKAVLDPYMARKGISALYVAALADPAATVDSVRAQALALIGSDSTPSGSMSIEHGEDESDKFRAGVSNALMARAGYAKQDNANPYRGQNLREIARACAERAGRSTRGMDIREVVAVAFTHSTSDFPLLLANTARQAMLRGFEESQETYPQFTRAGTLTDFKEMGRAGLGIFSSLDEIPEGAEYKYGTFGEYGQKVKLATYGKLFGITRQAVINDDMGAFTTVPLKMGRAAKRTIGDLVFDVLINNPTMADGTALFHADHGNLLTGAAITTASVDAMGAAMAVQTDPTGAPISVPLKFLLVPRALLGTANVVRDSEFEVGASTRNNTTPNSVRNGFDIIWDARLDRASATAWYGSADPALYDTIEVNYLDGQQEPYLEQKNGWDVDGTEFKVRIDAGVSPLDYRGLAKNPGA